MILIGMTGRKRTGKDTFAHMLCNELTARGHDKIEVFALADPIREMVFALIRATGVPAAEALHYLTENKELIIPSVGASVRRLMQTLGTEWGRNQIDTDLWINIAERRIEYAESVGCKVCIVTDIRFDNEAKLIYRLGGNIIRMERDTDYRDDHPSEQIPMRADEVIINNGTLDALRQQAVRVADGIAALLEAAEEEGDA